MPQFLTHVCQVARGEKPKQGGPDKPTLDGPGPKTYSRVADHINTADSKREARRRAAGAYPHRSGYRLGLTSLIGLLLFVVAGCCMPCGTGCPMPGPCTTGLGAGSCYAVPGCPRFAEIQHPYLDTEGRHRWMGDAHFRAHLAEP